MSNAARKARKRAGGRFLHQPSDAKRVPYRSSRYVRGADPLALPDFEPLLPLGVLPVCRGYTR